MDANGNLYGTTSIGGDKHCSERDGCGTVFKLAPDGEATVLVQFGSRGKGASPVSSLFLGKHGNLYGTTPAGGKFKDGVVFKLKK